VSLSSSSPELERERDFWDHAIPTLRHALHEYQSGPDPNTAAMLDALEPLDGRTVLDFACGAGVTSAWLAARGARVTGIDLSPKSIDRAHELCEAIGFDAKFIVGDLGDIAWKGQQFDGVVGRYALHHVDTATVGRVLSGLTRPGGTAAFVETMGVNPILRFARNHLVGRLGIPRWGTPDEHPLINADLETLRAAFGRLSVEVREMYFLRLLDRQVLAYRFEMVSRGLGRLDDLLLRVGRGNWSYHQVLVLTRL
jgi:SAM-dependent methyltransferase